MTTILSMLRNRIYLWRAPKTKTVFPMKTLQQIGLHEFIFFRCIEGESVASVLGVFKTASGECFLVEDCLVISGDSTRPIHRVKLGEQWVQLSTDLRQRTIIYQVQYSDGQWSLQGIPEGFIYKAN